MNGSATADEAWQRYTSPSRWPEWAPQISRVVTSDDPIRSGTRGVVHGPVLIRIPFEILDVDDASRRWSWRVGVGPVGLRMEHGIDEVSDGARAWVHIHAPRLLVLPYVPIAKWALRQLVAD